MSCYVAAEAQNIIELEYTQLLAMIEKGQWLITCHCR